MNWMRSSCLGFSAAWALATLAGAQVTTPEAEPNDNKASAQLVTMACGDIITGTTTGTSTTVAGAASADFFRVRTIATGGVVEYTMTITYADGTAPAHTLTLRGLNQSAGVIGTTDTTFQTGTATGAPANSKIVRWYGHGPAGANQDMYVKVTGATASTLAYSLTLTCTPVTPIAISGVVTSDTPVKVAPDAATDTGVDTDFWVLDSTLTPIPGFGHDDVDINGVTRACAPGTYYVAMGNWQSGNNLPSPADDTYLSGTVTDFPNVTVCATTGAQATWNCVVSNASGSNTGSSSRAAADVFRMPWFSFQVVPATAPTNPSLACSSGTALAGGSALITGTVTLGQNPTSTGLVVTGDLTSIGGPAAQPFYDDGSNGDAVAGDNVFSYAYSVPAATAAAAYSLPLTVTDSLARSGGCSASLTVDDAGSSIATARPIDGSGSITSIAGTMNVGDVDMFRIHICDPANFSASTVGGTTIDTQLWLFAADGHGIVMDDDEGVTNGTLQSRLTNLLTSTLTPGDYYLAISGYNQDAVDSANALLFNNTEATNCFGSGFRCEHGPDGPGGANVLDHWDGGNTGNSGAYTIALTGVSGSSCAPNTCCRNDYNGDGDVGTDLDIENFFSCLGGTCCPTCPPNADFNCDGDVGTDADIESFFRVLGGGAC